MYVLECVTWRSVMLVQEFENSVWFKVSRSEFSRYFHQIVYVKIAETVQQFKWQMQTKMRILATSPSTATVCTCNAGHEGPDDGVCSVWPPGKYKIDTCNAVCTNCAAGKYSTVVVSTCMGCPVVSQSNKRVLFVILFCIYICAHSDEAALTWALRVL